jgi:hypothetical protein
VTPKLTVPLLGEDMTCWQHRINVITNAPLCMSLQFNIVIEVNYGINDATSVHTHRYRDEQDLC